MSYASPYNQLSGYYINKTYNRNLTDTWEPGVQRGADMPYPSPARSQYSGAPATATAGRGSRIGPGALALTSGSSGGSASVRSRWPGSGRNEDKKPPVAASDSRQEDP